jgi:hypothetical protein
LAEFTAEKIKEFYDFCNKPEEDNIPRRGEQ